MVFRCVARLPEVFEVDWDDRFNSLPWREDKTEDIGQVLLNTETQSFAELAEWSDIPAAHHPSQPLLMCRRFTS